MKQDIFGGHTLEEKNKIITRACSQSKIRVIENITIILLLYDLHVFGVCGNTSHSLSSNKLQLPNFHSTRIFYLNNHFPSEMILEALWILIR